MSHELATHSNTRRVRSATLVSGLAILLAGLAQGTFVRAAAAASGSAYFPLASPQRLEDTRMDGKTLPAGGTIDVQVAGGTTGVPSSATSVVLNVTSVNDQAAGFLQVYPKGGSTNASAVNYYYKNQLTQNMVTVPIDPSTGDVTILSHAQDDVVVDEFGYYGAPASGSTAGEYKALSPQRICDTRGGSSSGCAAATTQQSGGVLQLQVGGNGGVPASGVSAVVINVTVADDTAAGFVQAYAHGTTRPTSPQTSNVNFNGQSTQFAGDPCPGNNAGSPAGCQIIANRVIVPVDSTGGVDLYTNQGPADLIVDVNGYFTDGTASTNQLFTPTAVTRLHDTRSSGDTIAANGNLNLPIAGSSSVIPTGASAAVLNVTIDKTTNAATSPGTGFLTVFPGPASAGGSPPLVSDLNYPASSIVPAAVYATLGSDGTINIHNGSGSPIDVIVDAFGYFAAPTQNPNHVSVTANPNSVPADGSSTSQVSVVVTNSGGTAVSGDPVTLAVTGTGCGTTSSPSPANGQTDSNGHITFTYTAGTAAGTCTVTATEQQTTQSGSTPITQTAAQLTLSPANQSVPAGAASTATISATAHNPDGSVHSGVTVYATVTAGPDNGETKNCLTGSAGTCNLTFTNNGTNNANHAAGMSGTDNVAAVLDTDNDGPETAPDSDGDSSANTEPSATASITWTAGAPASVLLEPGGNYGSGSNPSGASQPATKYPGGGTTTGTHSAVTNTVGQTETFTTAAYDANGNPVSGVPISFTDYHSNATNFNGSCTPTSGSGSTVSGCTVHTSSGTTDATGKATTTVTSTEEGVDVVYAVPTNSSGISSDGAEVDWGTSQLLVTPNYTAADVPEQVGQSSTYTVTSMNGSGNPNTNCTSARVAYENGWGAGPDADLYSGSPAYFSGVGSGLTAYSNNTCTTAITDFATSTAHTQIFFKPDATSGQFTFSIASASPASASPVVNSTGNNDTPQTLGDANDGFNSGDVVAGATTVWSSISGSAYNVALTPTAPLSVTAGSARTYTETVTLNGSPNTGNQPNAFSFQELANGTSTPGDIAYVEYTVGTKTYCVQGEDNNPPQTTCPSGDTASAIDTAGQSSNQPGGTGPTYTVQYSPYGTAPVDAGAGNPYGTTNAGANFTARAFTEAEVTGIGTFMVTISDQPSGGFHGQQSGGAPPNPGTCEIVGNSSTTPPAGCNGLATPLAWVDQNHNYALNSGEPNAVGGATTFVTPVGSSATLTTYPTTDPQDAFADGQYYQPANPNASPSPSGPGSGPTSYSLVASVNDQYGSHYVGATTYAVNWTLKNTGASTTNVYVDYASSGGTTYCTTDYSAGNPGNCTVGSSLNGAQCDFPNAQNGGTCNNTVPGGGAGTTTFVIPGGVTKTFTTYTAPGCDPKDTDANQQCSSVGVDSGDDTTLVATAQLAQQPTSGTAPSGAAIGPQATTTVNWAPVPASGGQVNGTVLTSDKVETGAEGGAGVESAHDWVVVQTTAGRRLVQFDQSASQTYTLDGTSTTEAVFETHLITGKAIVSTNYGAAQTNAISS